MGEEKIFKDLTKKYAELANKIHSKDKRSVSLIKDCSKRIALLDKLRVLEVSYLKCLKNKVKKGGVGGVIEDDEEERKQQEAVNQQEAEDIIGMELNKAKNTNDDGQDDSTPQNGNHQRALDVCTTALKKSMDLKDEVKKFIEKYIEDISNIYKGINKEDAITKLHELKDELINNKGMTRDDAILYLNKAGEILAEKVGDFYNNYKKTSLEEVINKLSQTGEKGVEKARQGVGIVNTTFRNTTGIDTNELLRKSIGLASKSAGIAKDRLTSIFGTTNQQQQQTNKSGSGGGKKTTYRLNGEKVVLLHKNKKVQRSIYVKDKGKTKYCKIDHQYILLSKLKNKIQ